MATNATTKKFAPGEWLDPQSNNQHFKPPRRLAHYISCWFRDLAENPKFMERNGSTGIAGERLKAHLDSWKAELLADPRFTDEQKDTHFCMCLQAVLLQLIGELDIRRNIMLKECKLLKAIEDGNL